MARFEYRGIAADGRAIAGTTEAASEAEAVARVRSAGQWVVDIREAQSAAATSRLLRARRSGLGEETLGLAFTELATLLRAGVPLDRALDLLNELADAPKLAKTLRATRDKVQSGLSLSDALAASGMVSDAGHLGLLRAGETGGALAETLAELGALLARAHRMKSAIRSALTYPSLVLAVAVGALGFMVLVVLPRFRDVFESAGQDMPAAAATLLTVGEALRDHGAAGLAALTVAGLSLALWNRSPSGAVALSRLRLGAPAIGPVARALDEARFCRTLALLVKNGVAPLEAARHSIAAMGAAALRHDARGFADDLGRGGALSEAMTRTGAFGRRSVGLARVGEESGALAPMLAHAAELAETDAERRAARSVQLIAPLATILLGALIAGIVVSMMGALLSVNTLV